MAERLLRVFIDTTETFQSTYYFRQCIIVFAVGLVYAVTKGFVNGMLPEGLASEFFSGHFLDILAPIALMGISNAIFCHFNFRVIRIGPILLLSAIAGLAWEFAAPMIIPWSVSDPLDLLSYMLGGLIYWLLSFPRALIF